DWGNIKTSGIPNQTEVDSVKNIKWEMRWDSLGEKSYRVHKYVWDPCSRPTGGIIAVEKITSNSAKVDWQPATNAVSYDIQYKILGKKKWKLKSTSNSSKKLKNLTPDTAYVYQVRSHCDGGKISGWTAIDTFKTSPLKIMLIEKDET